MSRDDLVQICGPADGIRLFNAIKGRWVSVPAGGTGCGWEAPGVGWQPPRGSEMPWLAAHSAWKPSPSLPPSSLTGALASESQPLGCFLWFSDACTVLGFELPLVAPAGGAGVDRVV